MAAIAVHVSTRLVLRLAAVSEGGKKITRRVAISGVRADASANALWEAAEAVGALLEYPVAAIELHTVSAIELTNGDRKEGLGIPVRNGKRRNARFAACAFSPAVSAHDTLLRCRGFADNISRPVLSRLSGAFTCRGTAPGQRRAPPARLANGRCR